MLSFPTRTISAGAIQVNGTLDPDDKVWLEGDARPSVPGVQVAGRLSVAGHGRYYFSGTLTGTVPGECRRCLGEVTSAIKADVQVLFADAGTADDEDPDVLPLVQGRTGSEVDLRAAVRQEWLLEIPALVECSPDCLGLCLNCGANLNQGPHECARKSHE